MIDYKLHEEIKLLTQNCYNPKTNFLPNDWELINFIPNTSSGFKAGIYKKDDYIVIFYFLTDFLIDFCNIFLIHAFRKCHHWINITNLNITLMTIFLISRNSSCFKIMGTI